MPAARLRTALALIIAAAVIAGIYILARPPAPAPDLPRPADPGATGAPGAPDTPGSPAANGDGAAPFDVVAGEPLIIALGDSLTDGQGVSRSQAWPARVERALAERGVTVDGQPWRVLNAGVSGDTTAGGLARLDRLLALEPRVLILVLGANDGLRGLPIDKMRENLETIILRARQAGVTVILAGMQMPPNYGEAYATAFAETYPQLADRLGLPLVPFLLAGVAAEPGLNQADGIHPNAGGYAVVADNVLQVLLPVLEKQKAAEPGGVRRHGVPGGAAG